MVLKTEKQMLEKTNLPKIWQWIIFLILMLLTFFAYEQSISNDFIVLDDGLYIKDNPHVLNGLTTKGMIWAFFTFHAATWQPLTWLSLMLDAQLYGADPSGYHLTNIILHMASTFLLFVFLHKSTQCFWRSILVAALFALHPLHVESVAWATERKDVLSAFFGMLSLVSYYLYCRRLGLCWYLLTVVTFLLGLMAKPMLVTLPIILLLLDYWPLQRTGRKKLDSNEKDGLCNNFLHTIAPMSLTGMIREKIPFFFLSITSCIITVMAGTGTGWTAVRSLEEYSITARILNALVSYIKYMCKMGWPDNLVIFYPHPGDSLHIWSGAGAALILGLISILVIRGRKSYPYLVTGWFWFIITLLPVIGVIQAGEQAMADRFTYIPLVGLFILIIWNFSEVFMRHGVSLRLIVILTVIIIAMLTIKTRTQVKYWQNSVTLYQHAVDVNKNNSDAHFGLYLGMVQSGRIDLAAYHYNIAVAINPHHVLRWHKTRTTLMLNMRKPEAAISLSNMALNIKHDDVEFLNKLGVALVMTGQYDEAKERFTDALEINPDFIMAQKNLYIVLKVMSAESGKYTLSY